MEQNDRLIQSIEKKLKLPMELPHQASTIAYQLFLLLVHFGATEEKVKSLVNIFLELISKQRFEDLANIQADYAIRIAGFDGKLEYEEMHKVFSLCDEIYALEYLGIELDKHKRKEFEECIRSRFRKEKKNAAIAARHNVEGWSSQLWWYKENLGEE